jgi:hypothetical protein
VKSLLEWQYARPKRPGVEDEENKLIAKYILQSSMIDIFKI